jgi:hypothetical protein
VEFATDENKQAVARAYAAAMSAVNAGQPISEALRLVYNIEHLMQEANSGASFEQYFRWASLDEIREVPGQLRSIGLSDVATIVERAIGIAFPSGLPATHEAKDELTDWSPEQESELGEIFTSLEALNGRVMNVLGEYALRVGA